MKTAFFVTGTDTGAGKTWFSLGLMTALKNQGLIVSGMKPVASGAERQSGVLVNNDALALQRQGSMSLDYRLINPYVFAAATAPHIAAKQAGAAICLDQILCAYRAIEAVSERVVVEGVGGWRVPLTDDLFLADLVIALKLPVILVVSMRIGCLNHALLTAERILVDGLDLMGWVANQTDQQMSNNSEYIAALEGLMPVPKLAEIPYMQSIDVAALAHTCNPLVELVVKEQIIAT